MTTPRATENDGEDWPPMSSTPGPCYICKRDPAEGFASIWTAKTGERWYCHGDDDDFSCYEGANMVDPDAFGSAGYLLLPPDVSEAHARRFLDREPPGEFTIADVEPSIPPGSTGGSA